MLGVPAILIGDNGYYEQKQAGLTESFGLPVELALRSDGDPADAAASIARLLDGGVAEAALRERIAAGAARERRRRVAAEAELLGRIGAGALATLDEAAADDSGAAASEGYKPGSASISSSTSLLSITSLAPC